METTDARCPVHDPVGLLMVAGGILGTVLMGLVVLRGAIGEANNHETRQ